jgi:hypothetical protein
MPTISSQAIAKYLEALYGVPVRLIAMTSHGTQEEGDDLKGFGYGSPLFLEYEVAQERKKAVLETMAPSSFGHDHFADRAQSILWEHQAFNDLPRHVRSLDSGAFLDTGRAISTGASQEFFLLTEFVAGNGYFKDLDRISETGSATDQDRKRCLALSSYLADIHSRKLDAPGLYARRIRDLVGHGECIMGLIDNYPQAFEFIDQGLLKGIETSCVEWRWRIKHRTHRLCCVHGDFHPYNILFREGTDFTLLDRSRGEWGEPADDTTCISINFLLSSLLRFGRLDGPFELLFSSFWDDYLAKTNDQEMLDVAAPFFAWRGLVVASPVWYPRLPVSVRQSLFRFIRNVLDSESFDPSDVNRYLR